MAHAIIFMDRAPRTRPDDYTSFHLANPAGPFKVASVVRDMGLDALVVPHCYNFSFEGLKKIIDNNSKDLLWVGISTTFMGYDSESYDVVEKYRDIWNSESDCYIDTDFLLQKNQNSYFTHHHNLWSIKELGKIGFYLEKKFKVPLLLGGMGRMMSDQQYNPSSPFHRNIHFVKGYAEMYVKEFTQQKLADSSAQPPLFVNNTSYDDEEFKLSSIHWKESDFVKEYDWLPIETARGCAFNCAYCNYPRRSKFDSYKDPKSLREEIIRNYDKFGVTRYNVIDDLYNDSKEKVRILHDEVWSKLPFEVEWVANMRLDMIWSDPDSAALLRDGGCKFGQFGVETLHEVAGRKVGKGLGRKRIIETLEFLKPIWGNDALVSLNFIAGLPYEPLDSIKETMEWSVTTDLFYSANWQPLFIMPPDRLSVASAIKPNKIETDNDHFKVEWLGPNEWQNSAGVKFSDVANLCLRTVDIMPTKFKINIRNYMDLRTMGFSHDRIANLKINPISDSELKTAENWAATQIDHRIQSILNMKL